MRWLDGTPGEEFDKVDQIVFKARNLKRTAYVGTSGKGSGRRGGRHQGIGRRPRAEGLFLPARQQAAPGSSTASARKKKGRARRRGRGTITTISRSSRFRRERATGWPTWGRRGQGVCVVSSGRRSQDYDEVLVGFAFNDERDVRVVRTRGKATDFWHVVAAAPLGGKIASGAPGALRL